MRTRRKDINPTREGKDVRARLPGDVITHLDWKSELDGGRKEQYLRVERNA
jgi:hypothetical protein